MSSASRNADGSVLSPAVQRFLNDRVLLVAIFMAVALPWPVVFAFRAHIFAASTFSSEVGQVASSVAQGRGFSSPVGVPTGPTAWFTPVYPLLLAAILKIFGFYTASAAIAVRGLNIVFHGALCMAAYWAALPVLGRSTARLGAFLTALYPQAIYTAATLMWDTSFLTAALMLVIGVALRMEIEADSRTVVACGLAMGITLLIDPAPLPFFMFLIVWRCWQEWARPCAARNMALLILIPCALFGPWMVRNYFATGVFTPRCCIGVELMVYNVDGASHPSLSSQEQQLYKTLGEKEYNSVSLQKAEKAIRNDPGKYAARVLLRIRDWWFGGNPKEYRSDLHGLPDLNILAHLLVAGALLFAIFGAYQGIRQGAKIIPLIALLLIYPVPYYLINVTDRYALPMRVIALLLTAHGLVTALRQAGAKQSPAIHN